MSSRSSYFVISDVPGHGGPSLLCYIIFRTTDTFRVSSVFPFSTFGTGESSCELCPEGFQVVVSGIQTTSGSK